MVAVAVFTAACGGVPEPLPAEYRARIEAFRETRASEIIAPTGWAALVGLHWLEPGTHTIGGASGSDVRLTGPSAPPSLGILTVTAEAATLVVAKGVEARRAGETVATVEWRPSSDPEHHLIVGGMTVALIRRGDRLALRVWDAQAASLVPLAGLEWMPIDESWRVQARFQRHVPARRMKILNVIDEVVDMRNPGVAVFRVGAQEYRLEALLESDTAEELFFMFRDATSGATTYGAGRYLYTPLPKDGRVILDFNQAKNPPCTFTDFATCPLPPKGNILALAVMAGELDRPH